MIMIIKIENATKDNVLNKDFLISIENILRSFAEEKHLLIASREFFRDIINSEGSLYSTSSKHFASEALSGQVEYHSLINMVSFYVSVDFTIKDTSFKWVDLGIKYKFVCGPLFFSDSSQLQKTKIVCENPLDSDFFKIIASFYAKRESLSGCSINFSALNGGGGSTKDIFERVIKNNEIAFCIVDNDKKHPGAPFGGTSAHFTKSKINRSGLVEILNVHEIESLVPFETIEKVLSELNLLTGKQQSLNFFKKLCSIDETAKFYFDHKKGFDLKTALELDNAHGDYWRPILKKMSKDIQCDCIGSKKCECKPSCLTYDGFGDGLLNNTLRHINQGSLKRYNPPLSPKLYEKWYELGKNLFSWSCGPYKKSRLS